MLKGKPPRLQVNYIEGIIYDMSKVAQAKLYGQHNLRDQQQGKERACAAKRTTLRQIHHQVNRKENIEKQLPYVILLLLHEYKA